LADAIWFSIIDKMAKKRNFIDTTWSEKLAYVIGIIASDGNLSPDLRHINITSKDEEMLLNIKSALGIKNTVGRKSRGGSRIKKYFVIQFGSHNFYEFLLQIGLTPAKSKTIKKVEMPDQYFRDFLRGCIDGDGNINVFTHPESKHPQLRIRLSSASPLFLLWMQKTIKNHTRVMGGWIEKQQSVSILNYAKSDAMILLNFMYYENVRYYLTRKYTVGKRFLRM